MSTSLSHRLANTKRPTKVRDSVGSSASASSAMPMRKVFGGLACAQATLSGATASGTESTAAAARTRIGRIAKYSNKRCTVNRQKLSVAVPNAAGKLLSEAIAI